MRAAFAIPGIFTPVGVEQFLLTVQSALGMESAAAPAPETAQEVATHLSLSDVLIGTFDTMQASITRYRLAAYPPDILIELTKNICEPHDFHRATELIEAGRYWTRLQLERNPELNEAELDKGSSDTGALGGTHGL